LAGEWLKFESSLPEKPETLAITVAMGWDDPDLTVGKLMRVFRWFDQHTIDGNAHGVTAALLDRLIGVTGFVQAMANAGWIVVSPDGLALHNFDRHNGATAKSRAQTAKRVANHRGNGECNAESNAPTVTPALAREEKRREEKKEKTLVAVAPRARRVPGDFVVTQELIGWAALKAPSVDLDSETEAFKDWEFKTARSDWPAAWRAWMRKAAKDAKPKAGETAWQRSQRERAHEISGGLAAAKPPGQRSQLAEDFHAPFVALG